MDRRGRSPPKIKGMVSLKVDNLPFRSTVDDLKRIFSRYGELGDVYIPRDPYTMESRGFAFVRYYDRRDAEDAIDRLDGYRMENRELRVQMARYSRPDEPTTRRRGYKDDKRDYSPRRSRRSRSRSRSRSESSDRDKHASSRRRRSANRRSSSERSRS